MQISSIINAHTHFRKKRKNNYFIDQLTNLANIKAWDDIRLVLGCMGFDKVITEDLIVDIKNRNRDRA